MVIILIPIQIYASIWAYREPWLWYMGQPESNNLCSHQRSVYSLLLNWGCIISIPILLTTTLEKVCCGFIKCHNPPPKSAFLYSLVSYHDGSTIEPKLAILHHLFHPKNDSRQVHSEPYPSQTHLLLQHKAHHHGMNAASPSYQAHQQLTYQLYLLAL